MPEEKENQRNLEEGKWVTEKMIGKMRKDNVSKTK
jgi:hypothetical protein